jgi:hypothetical protein
MNSDDYASWLESQIRRGLGSRVRQKEIRHQSQKELGSRRQKEKVA